MFKSAVAILCPLALCLASINAQPADLTADQIIQKHLDAMGGAAKLKAIQSFKATGTASLMGGQMEAPITLIMKRPTSMRLEMSVQGKSFIQAFDGTTSWQLNPFMGSPDPQKMSEEDTASAREDPDFIEGPLVDSKAKGNTVELMGKEDVDGTSAYKFKITKKSGTVSYLFLDAQTFLDLKSSGHRKQMGQEMDIETTTSNFKPVNGVMMPFSIEQKVAGNTMMQMTIEKLEANVTVDDSVFHFPDKPKEEKPAEKQ